MATSVIPNLRLTQEYKKIHEEYDQFIKTFDHVIERIYRVSSRTSGPGGWNVTCNKSYLTTLFSTRVDCNMFQYNRGSRIMGAFGCISLVKVGAGVFIGQVVYSAVL